MSESEVSPAVRSGCRALLGAARTAVVLSVAWLLVLRHVFVSRHWEDGLFPEGSVGDFLDVAAVVVLALLVVGFMIPVLPNWMIRAVEEADSEPR